jgi:hypothetical protein
VIEQFGLVQVYFVQRPGVHWRAQCRVDWAPRRLDGVC